MDVDKEILQIEEFRKDLTRIINIHGLDTMAGTPDIVLSGFIIGSFFNYLEAETTKMVWRATHGRM
jgi:hypothetical protein